MATNTAKEQNGSWVKRIATSGHKRERVPDAAKGSVAKDRVQIQNPVTGHWIKVDTSTGRIIDEKVSDGPFKGIAIRPVGKRPPKN